MRSSKLGFLTVALLVILSMLLSACGAETPTATPATSAATDTPAAAAAATDTPAAAAGDTPTTGTTGGTTSGDTVKIGVDLPGSGGDASDGIPTRNGMQLAIDQANKAGGVTVAGKQYKLEMYA